MNYPDVPGYTIKRRLGTGGMASVYLAEQETFGRLVALKVMAEHLAPDPSFGSRFLREARIVAQMSHRNFVPVFDVGTQGDLHYMSMEYLPNGDLRTLLQNGLPLAEALNIVRDIASGLHYAASKNFVHRDIKPENILFREDNSPVITDFGIARDTQSATQMTVIGTVMGTPHYMSPEQARAEEIDGRSDLYNLGIIVYEMLSGQVPYDAPSALATSIKHLNDPIPLLPPALTGFQAFINRALAKHPDDRFQTGEEMIDALDRLESVEQATITETFVKCSTEREESGLPSPDAPETRLVSAEHAARDQVTRPVTRRTSRRRTTAGMRADPSDAGRTQTIKPAAKSSTTGWVLALLLAAIAAGGAYYWQTYLRSPPTSPAPAALAPPVEAGPVTADAGLDRSAAGESPGPVTEAPIVKAQAGVDGTKVQQLLASAEKDIEEYRLSSPSGNNAVEKYRSILELSPGNAAALQGLEKVATRYAHMAQTAIGDNRLDEAERYLRQGVELAPDNTTVRDSLLALEQAQGDADSGSAGQATAEPSDQETAEDAAEDMASRQAAERGHTSLEPLPDLPADELLAMAAGLGGPDAVDSGNFRKLGQIYGAVLASSPGSAVAQRGLDNSRRYAADYVDNSLLVGQLGLAATQIGYLAEIDPAYPRLAELQARLDEMRASLASEASSEARNELLLTLIEEEKDPEVLLSDIEDTLSEPYPIGGTAEEYRSLARALKPTRYRIEAARRLSPGDPRLAESEARLGRRYADVSRELIELGELASARSLLDEASTLSVSAPELDALQTLLETMQDSAVPPEEKPIIEQIF